MLSYFVQVWCIWDVWIWRLEASLIIFWILIVWISKCFNKNRGIPWASLILPRAGGIPLIFQKILLVYNARKDGGFALPEIDSRYCEFGPSRREIQLLDFFCLMLPPGALDQQIASWSSKQYQILHSIIPLLYLSVLGQNTTFQSGGAKCKWQSFLTPSGKALPYIKIGQWI